jgi:hypothetical protein
MSYVPWELEVQFAPGFSPLDLPTDGDWVSLGEPDGLSIRRGRQDDLDEFEAGAMTVVLDNADESLDHLLASSAIYDVDALPYTPLRLVASKGSEDRVIFNGFTLDGFTPAGLRGGGSVTVQVTDWLGWAVSQTSQDCQWGAWAAWARPKVWMRGLTTRPNLDYATNSDQIAWNSAAVYTGAFGDMAGDPAYPEVVNRRDSSIVTGSSMPHFALGTSVALGGLVMDVGDTIAQTGRWMAAGWFQTPDVSSITWAGSDWQVYLNGSGHLVAEVDVAGFNETATAVANHADDVVHMWILTVTSTGGSRSMKIHTDMADDTHIIGAAGVSGGGVLNFRGVGLSDCEVGDFVYWDDTSTLDLIFLDLVSYAASMGPESWAGATPNAVLWDDETSNERFRHLCGTVGAALPEFQFCGEVDHGLNQYDPSGSFASDVRAIGSAYLGGTYCLRDGTVRIRDASFTAATVGDGTSTTYPFGHIEAAISDDSSTDTWTATVTDTFTRANNANLGGSWKYGGIGGTLGIISNTAYVSVAPTVLPADYYQDLGRDVTAECGFTAEVEGQGLIVRRSRTSTFVSVEVGATTVVVNGWVDGVSTLIGDTGDPMGSSLTVTTDDNTITVQIDAGTVHEFTITDPDHMAGTGVGLVYTNLSVLPANTARWDNFSATAERPLIRATNRTRTAPRADRVVNSVTVDYASGGTIYYRDADSIRRYGERPKVFTSSAGGDSTDIDNLQEFTAAVLAERKDPTIEVGELVVMPWGNQYVTDWVMRDLELERAVTYREALYRAGTEVLDATYRVTGESWDWQSGVDWTVTLKIVPA